MALFWLPRLHPRRLRTMRRPGEHWRLCVRATTPGAGGSVRGPEAIEVVPVVLAAGRGGRPRLGSIHQCQNKQISLQGTPATILALTAGHTER